MLVTSLKYTPVAQSIRYLNFLMCIATMHHYKLQWTKISKQSEVYGFDIPVTLTLDQGHQVGIKCYTQSKVIITQSFKDLP